MSLNSTDSGFSIFAATEAFALSSTGSGVCGGRRSDAVSLILVGCTASLARASRLCDSERLAEECPAAICAACSSA